MSTLSAMKTRIAEELRRDDLAEDIANAISSAIEAYQNERFAKDFGSAPAADGETGNAWMTTAERLIRSRAKLEVFIHVVDDPEQHQSTLKNLGTEIDDALRVLRQSTAQGTSATSGTLGAMKLRIKNEIGRGDIDDDIANAINDAIEAYEDKRFYFNETRSFTFTTVQDQDRYAASDSGWENLANVLKIDFVIVLIGGQPYDCIPKPPHWFEHNLITSTNWPNYYGWYDESLILYPTPAGAYQVRIGCVEKAAAPASDAEANNPWMTKAERLIRNRAKAELYAHVDDISDDKKAAKFMGLAETALDQLEERTARQTKTGPYRVRAWC
ncbi:hypothetical protein [Filomicrobium sp.]|uniref:phage adaptor protein n=1 Tax=Filomicrobium sp. TaxID=2024831 RepID=UPI0025888346|nr:hypothetical protein [Filomicrobium sp.]MCV0371720.1 hypothetical protein [Filomicrobium sp.]